MYCKLMHLPLQLVLFLLGQRETADGPVLPIQCVSKKLTETQQRYSTIEREAHAVVWAAERLVFIILY